MRCELLVQLHVKDVIRRLKQRQSRVADVEVVVRAQLSWIAAECHPLLHVMLAVQRQIELLVDPHHAAASQHCCYSGANVVLSRYI